MFWIAVICICGMSGALVEKLIKHRLEVIAMRLEHERLKASATSTDLQALHDEVRELKMRLDEQTILVDDLMRSFPKPETQIQQRIGGL